MCTYAARQARDDHHPWVADTPSRRSRVHPNPRPSAGCGVVDQLGEVDRSRPHRPVPRRQIDENERGVIQQPGEESHPLLGIDSGMSDAEWWGIAAPVLGQVMADDSLVLSARVGGAVGSAFDAAQNPAHAMAFGLDTILDGIQARIRGHLS